MSFPRYPEYEDSGVEWLGRVPAHWEVAPLKRYWTAIDCKHITAEVVDEGFPIASIREVQSRWVMLDDAKRTTEKCYEILIEGGRRPMPGDLIFSRNATVGEVGQVHADHPRFAMGQDVVLLRKQSPEFSSDYFQQTIRSAVVIQQLDVLMIGSTFKRINVEEIRALVFPIPPAPEQTAIAAFLELETAKIDALVVEQERLIELLKEKRQAVIFRAVTKGLNPDAAMRHSGIEWLGKVPAHWELRRLKHISPFITVGIVVNPSTFVVDDGLPFIYGGDIREGVIDWESSRRITAEGSKANPKTILREGDLLTVRVGAPGVTAVVPRECEGGNCASVMLVRQGPFSSDWLCFAMNTHTVRFQVEVVQYGAAQEQFNIGHAVNFWVPTPPPREQAQIASFLKSEVAVLEALITEAQSAIALLQERRAALISAAVTGQIDVRATTPNAPVLDQKKPSRPERKRITAEKST